MVRLKKFWAVVFSVCLIFSAASAQEKTTTAPAQLTTPAPTTTTPEILADSAILIETSTGKVLYEKNADVRRPPASMTKIMTCVLGIENLKPTQEIKIDEEVAQTGDSYFYFQTNEVLSVEEIFKSMMLVSDNGAATAIAKAVGKSVPNFAKMMNDKARELGCTNTTFMNPHGLPDDKHLSTARDMAKIAIYCMKDPEFRRYVSTQKAVVHWISPKKSEEVENTNKLLGKCSGTTGMKTGWTKAAAGCLAASAKRNGVELIAIVMHSPDTVTRFEDAQKLIEYGFTKVKSMYSYQEKKEEVVYVRGGKQGIVHVNLEGKITYPLFDGDDEKNFSVTYELPKIVDGGIERGAEVGKATLSYNGKPVASIPFVAQEAVAEGFSWSSAIVGISEKFPFAQEFLLTLVA